MALDKNNQKQIMPDSTAQHSTAQQDSSNRFSESNKGVSGQSESIQRSGYLPCNQSNRLQRPTKDSKQVICCKLNKMPEGHLTEKQQEIPHL